MDKIDFALLETSHEVYDVVQELKEETKKTNALGDKLYTLTTEEATLIVLAAQMKHIERALKDR